MQEIVLPSTLEIIGNNAFTDSDGLISITIPISITEISDSLFESCDSLTEVTISSETTSIGESAFKDCVSLKSISLPGTITSIGADAFTNSGLVNAQTGVSVIKYVDDWVVGCDTSVTNATIKDGTRGIADQAFANRSLKGLNLPEGLEIIGKSAFKECKISELVLPESLTTVGDRAFYYCTYLTSLTFPKNVVSIGERSFYTAGANLQSVTFENPDTVIYMDANTIHKNAQIYGYLGSTAEEYATTFGREFVYLTDDITDPTDPENPEDTELFGDINGDGLINASDSALILAYSAAVASGNTDLSLKEFVQAQQES